MDINNNQQTNTFTRGMDTDTSDMYIGEGSYRYAENLRVVTNEDSNSGELHIIEGTNKINLDKEIPGVLLGYTSIRDYILAIVLAEYTNNTPGRPHFVAPPDVVLPPLIPDDPIDPETSEGASSDDPGDNTGELSGDGENDDPGNSGEGEGGESEQEETSTTTNKWSIYRIKVTEENNHQKIGHVSLVAGPFEEQIWPDDWKGKTKPLSLVTRWEAEDNVKLYIANGKTELLSINVAPEFEYSSGETFSEVFRTTRINLSPIIAEATNVRGAKIPGVVIQYAYIVYKINGPASTLSVLSNVVTEKISNVLGYRVDFNGEYVINLTMPSEVLNKYVRVFRIAYSKAGQLPRVDIIYDQKCSSQVIKDSGQSIQNISSAEFIATNSLLFTPKEIESKGDYLFIGNIKYTQDEIDEQFKKFDARCYSAGNYYNENNEPVPIGNNASDTLLSSLSKDIDLRHYQFDNSQNILFDTLYWIKNSDGFNGHGLCFDWKYVFDTNDLYFTEQYGKDNDQNYIEPPRTYARNEVYRFGVRLFDAQGNASSIKWIADIKMPDYFEEDFSYGIKDYVETYNNEDKEQKVKTNSISIEFTPRNTDQEYWNGVARYEIVLAKRSIHDSYKITQGVAGYPMAMTDGERCLPYFLTRQPFVIYQGLSNAGTTWGAATFELDRRHLIFCSPEYAYQPDDIQSLLKENSLDYREISCFTRLAKDYNDGGSYIVLGYRTGQDISNLTYNPIDLRIISTIDNSSRVCYTMSQELMGYFNHNTLVQRNGVDVLEARPGIGYGPIGGNNEVDARKNVFFTNMYAQLIADCPGVYRQINSIAFEDAQENNIASGEWPTYRSLFKILTNGDKFYNWTNPAIMRKWMYEVFTSGGSTTQEGWLECTMSSRQDGDINVKYLPFGNLAGTSYEDHHVLEASSSLCFPTSTGGPNMILEFDSNINYPAEVSTSSFSMPDITIANIYQPATPYGGYNINSINNTQYISQGYYSSPNGGPIKVSMGDNYITMFVYFLYHAIDNAQNNDIPTAAAQYIVPIESTMDLSKQCSDYIQATCPQTSDIACIGNHGVGVWLLAKPSTVAGRFNLVTDMYMYNTAYSVLPDTITYSAEDTINQPNSIYDSRIHYSQKKQNNELIDNWTSFKAIDYLDVDSRYGQITGLKLFKDKLIFLQENGAGVLSVNDRIILKDQESANIIVGNGGVLDRYDYFTTIYGMKPDQHAIEASNDALYWWDGYRKEIIGYTDGYNVNLLQRIKNVANYINKGTESHIPSIIYDADNKEVLFNVVNDKCIVYNEQIQQFTSVYTFNPVYYSNINGSIYLTDLWDDEEHLYEYNKYNSNNEDGPMLFEEEHYPTLKYIVNKEPTYNKVFDVQTFGGRFYEGNTDYINLYYYTPLKQHSSATGNKNGITSIEYDYRLAIPRNNNDAYGGRMRGKTMECVLTSSSNDKDFSIQYVTTKYRMSWS